MKKGTVFYIEFKRPGKEATPMQKYIHSQFLEIGGVTTFVVDNIISGKKIIDKYTQYVKTLPEVSV